MIQNGSIQNGSTRQPPSERDCDLGRYKIGERFNPWRDFCGFYPPDIVAQQRDLSDGQKRLYERGVRWAGKNGVFWYAFPSMAEALGKSVRQVKHDMATLEAKGLLGHTRRRRQSNLYHFLWHVIFEVQSSAHQEVLGVQNSVNPEALKVQSTAPELCHKPESHHHQKEELESSNGGVRANSLPKPQKPDDDEKPAQEPAAPEIPKTVFLSRIAQRHPEIDAPACFADVQSELRKGPIPFDAFLRRDLLTTTNPKALTNPRGYYRGLAKTMVAEHQTQMAGIPTEGVLETPRCAKCNGSGYLLERIEGLRPLQTGEFCDCKLGEDLAAIERRAAKKAAAAVERKQPGQAPGQAAMTAAGGLQ